MNLRKTIIAVSAMFLCLSAINAGVDAVKFQILHGDRIVSSREDPERHIHFKKFELQRKQFESLAKICMKNKVKFAASVWDRESISWVNPLVSFYKVGSGDLTAFPLIYELVKTTKPILLSTGLSTISEVHRTVDFIRKCDDRYIKDKKLVLLQCTSSYPCPDRDANLRVIETLKNEFDLPVGYSDHTFGTEAAYLAVLLGAQVIELHFTDKREGRRFRDHQISVTCGEAKELIKRIQRAKVLLGSAEKKVTFSEKKNGHVKSFRRGVYAMRNLKSGQSLSLDDLTILRPEHGIPAWRFNNVVTKSLRCSRRKHDPIRTKDIQ